MLEQHRELRKPDLSDPELTLQQKRLISELAWRLNARDCLVEYAKAIPIPGVPQDDNHDEHKMVEELASRLEDCTTEEERREVFRTNDGRFDNNAYIPRIKLDLAPHHILMLNTAQAIIEGDLIAPDGSICRRGMFFMPPGSAKSTYLDVVVPTWCMGKYPGEPIILTSYADMLAMKHGKRARQVCMSPEFKAIFDTSLDPATKAADKWALTNGSEYLAAGLQSGLTGNRSFGAIWDDPVKGRRAAESIAEQTATFDAYRDDFRTRKQPNAWELGIMTRWHQKDLAGNILPDDWNGESGFIKGKDGYWWYVTCIQAQCETDSDPLGRAQGMYLWEEWFHTEGSADAYWAPFKLDTRAWGSLYQQVPTPPEGTYFKQEWVQYYPASNKPSPYSKFYMSADYAVTAEGEGDDPDLTSMGIWELTTDGRLLFRDGWHGLVDAGEWTDIAIDFMEVHKPLAHCAGGGPIRRGTEHYMRRRMRERKTFTRLVWYPETHGKEENCRDFQAMMSNGMVYWPEGHEEANWVIRHLIGYGTLRYDDAFDMCAMMGRHVAYMWERQVPPAPEDPPILKAGVKPIQSIMPKDMARMMKARR